MNQEVPVLSSAAPWPSRPELGTVTVERGQGPITDGPESYDAERWNPGLLQRQLERVEVSRVRVLQYDNETAELQDRLRFLADQRQQEQVHITNALAIITKQRALQPVVRRTSPSDRERLFDRIASLYQESSASGKAVTFSILPEILDKCANDRTQVDNRTTGQGSRSHCIGVFGRGSLFGDYTVSAVVEKARSMQGKPFDVLRNELGLA